MLATRSRYSASAAPPAARPLSRRRGARPSLLPGVRRYLLHLFCFGLVWLAAVSPLAAATGVGSRAAVNEAVQRYARLLEARADYSAPGGWSAPPIPITLDELNQVRPPSPALPAPGAETSVARAPTTLPPAPSEGLPSSAQVETLAGPTSLGHSRAREAAREALAERFVTLSDAYGVVVLDAEASPIFEHRAGELFQAASLYKLGVAAEVYRQARAGLVNLKDPLIITRESLLDGDTLFAASDIGRKIAVGEAVDYMITRSSNVSALLLLKKIGPANVNALFGTLGLKDTRLLERPFRNLDGNARNQTSPRDMGRFFSQLLHYRVVDAETSQLILRLLFRQRIDDRLPAALPSGVPVAHKTGNLIGVVHDAGIIYSPAGPLITVVLSQDVPSEEEAQGTIAELARVAYDAYTTAALP